MTKECKESKDLYSGVRVAAGCCIAILSYAILFGTFPVHPAYGSILGGTSGSVVQNLEQMRQKVVTGGPYANNQWGVSANLPPGWHGLTNQTDWYLDVTLFPPETALSNIPALASGNLQNIDFQSISLTVIDKSNEPAKVATVDPLVSLAQSFGCATESDAYDTINGISFHAMTKACPKSGPKVELKQYTFDAGTREYDFWYLTKPANNSEFYQYLGTFDNAAQSIWINGYSHQGSSQTTSGTKSGSGQPSSNTNVPSNPQISSQQAGSTVPEFGYAPALVLVAAITGLIASSYLVKRRRL